MAFNIKSSKSPFVLNNTSTTTTNITYSDNNIKMNGNVELEGEYITMRDEKMVLSGKLKFMMVS